MPKKVEEISEKGVPLHSCNNCDKVLYTLERYIWWGQLGKLEEYLHFCDPTCLNTYHEKSKEVS